MKTIQQGLGRGIIGYLFIGVLFVFVLAMGFGTARADTGSDLGCAFANMIGASGVPIPLDSIGCATATTTSTSGNSGSSSSTPSTPNIDSLIQQTVHDAIASSTTINITQGSTSVTGTVDPFTGLNVQVNTPFGGISLFDPICSLVIKKIVVGGTALASDFSIHLKQNGADVSGSPQAGSVTGNSYGSIKPGTYTVSETGGPSGYTATFSGECDANGNITMQPNGSAVCIITNTFATSTGTSTPPGGGGGDTGGGGGGGGGGTPGGGGSGGGTPGTGVSGGGSSGGGGGGGNGPIASNGPILGGGGFSPGEVLGASIEQPGVPNTGVGDTMITWMILLISAFSALAGAATLSKLQTDR